MYFSDAAILTENDDILGRAPFARKLGEQLLGRETHDSRVVGLYGPWGYGKTSILNLAISYVRERTKNDESNRQPLIIEFNPWNYSRQEGLLFAFLQQLYSEVNARLPSTQKDFQSNVNKLAKLLGAFERVPIVGWALFTSGKVLGEIVPDQSLQGLRKKVDDFFKNLDFKTIVVIDDLDRLTAVEIRDLFKVIKVNANFPNTIYLVSCDREIVEQSLNSIQGTSMSGRSYVEKIIQVAFDIPSLEGVRLEEFLTTGLNEILREVPESDWDRERWIDVYHSGFKSLFGSIRDAKRFLNALSFTLGSVREEVNPIDFTVLEALRVLVPDVYYGIARQKDVFTNIQYRETPTERQTRLDAIDGVVARAGGSPKASACKALCARLFPATQTYMGGTAYSGDYRQIWRRERRICSPEIFDTYFILGVPKGEIPQAEMLAVVQSAHDRIRFPELLDNLVNDGRILRFLNLAQDQVSLLDAEGVACFVENLVVLAERLAREVPESVFEDSDFRIARLIYLALQKLDGNSRCSAFHAWIDRFGAMYQIVFVLSLDGREAGGRNRNEALFDDTCLRQLQQHCAGALAQGAKSGELLASRRLLYKLFRWREWGNARSDVQRFLEDALCADETVLRLVRGLVTPVQVFGGGQTHTELQVNMKNVAELLNPSAIATRLDEIAKPDSGDLDDEDRAAIRAFRESHLHWIQTNGADDFPYRAR